MRYLFIFIGKCLSIVIFGIIYLGYVFANIGLCIWFFKLSEQLTWYRYSDGLSRTPKETYIDYIDTYKY